MGRSVNYSQDITAMGHRLALYTFGVFAAPSEDPVNDGFHQRNDPILTAVEHAQGFIARSGYEDEPGSEPWGEQVYPSFYVERGDGWSPATLSLWIDLESAFAFSYSGLHGESLAHGREWMVKPEWPPYVLWWVEENHRPIWHEAVACHLLLHKKGPTSGAFNFKKPFDVRAQVTKIDRVRATAYVATFGDELVGV